MRRGFGQREATRGQWKLNAVWISVLADTARRTKDPETIGQSSGLWGFVVRIPAATGHLEKPSSQPVWQWSPPEQTPAPKKGLY